MKNHKYWFYIFNHNYVDQITFSGIRFLFCLVLVRGKLLSSKGVLVNKIKMLRSENEMWLSPIKLSSFRSTRFSLPNNFNQSKRKSKNRIHVRQMTKSHRVKFNCRSTKYGESNIFDELKWFDMTLAHICFTISTMTTIALVWISFYWRYEINSWRKSKRKEERSVICVCCVGINSIWMHDSQPQWKVNKKLSRKKKTPTTANRIFSVFFLIAIARFIAQFLFFLATSFNSPSFVCHFWFAACFVFAFLLVKLVGNEIFVRKSNGDDGINKRMSPYHYYLILRTAKSFHIHRL